MTCSLICSASGELLSTWLNPTPKKESRAVAFVTFGAKKMRFRPPVGLKRINHGVFISFSEKREVKDPSTRFCPHARAERNADGPPARRRAFPHTPRTGSGVPSRSTGGSRFPHTPGRGFRREMPRGYFIASSRKRSISRIYTSSLAYGPRMDSFSSSRSALFRVTR